MWPAPNGAGVLQERVGDLVVNVLLLQDVWVLKRDLAVKVLQPGSLAEAEELVVNKTVLNACPALS